METKIFAGKNVREINKQKWAWHADNPNAVVIKIHPVEITSSRSTGPNKKDPAADAATMRMDYEDSK
jgi:hypothetical protein